MCFYRDMSIYYSPCHFLTLFWFMTEYNAISKIEEKNMLTPDYRQDNLLLCQPTKAIENYYKGYREEITYFYQQAVQLTKRVMFL